MKEIILLAAIPYVAWRIYKILPVKKWLKLSLLAVYCLAVVACALSAIGLIDLLPMPLARFTYIFGNSWVIFMIYATILFVLMDVLRLMRLLPARALENSIAGSAVVFGLIAVLLTYGAIHYRHKYREEMTVESAKIDQPLKIVLLSDLHIGYHNSHRELSRWVDLINAEKPDLVLLGGDLMDRSLRAAIADHDASRLLKIQAPVYACRGNHEYHAGIEASDAFYKTAGITLVVDSVVSVRGISLVCREDVINETRRPLHRLMKMVPKGQFTIVLDHEPTDLLEAQLNNVDFQFSGHTHNGQVWPLNWLERMVFENSYGQLKKGDTRYYVTSGMGIGGGRFRIGTRSEYLVLNLVPETTPEN